MKISFNTQTTPSFELVMLIDVINDILSKRDDREREVQNAVHSGDFVPVDIKYNLSGVDSKVSVAITDIKTAEQFVDEFEPDDADDVITDAQIAEMPCVKNGEASVEGIIREFEAITDVKVTRTVVPPPPPPASVIPPPPPQVAAEVSTGSNEGVGYTPPPFGGYSATPIYDPENPPPMDEELDSDGKPWDATVHSESRAKNVDGTWRKRRNTKNVEVKAAIPGLEAITPNSVPAPPAERKMIRTFVRIDGGQNLISAPEGATDEELSAITGKPTMREDRYQAAQASTVTPELSAVVADTFQIPTVPQVPPAPPAPPPVVKTAAPGSPAGTWSELMERVTKYFASQQITSIDLAEICKTFGINSMQECFTQTHLIPLVSNAIDQKAASK